jgi:four helix bundle protein
MAGSILKIKSFGFAIRIVRLLQFLRNVKKEYVLAKQLLRCGTSVGSMIREAEYAESKADFIHKRLLRKKKLTNHYTGWSYWQLLII